MARNNYSYQKYRREQAKKKKREEKLQKKLDRKNRQAGEGADGAPEAAGQVPGAEGRDQAIDAVGPAAAPEEDAPEQDTV
jgi:hypothetical protein